MALLRNSLASYAGVGSVGSQRGGSFAEGFLAAFAVERFLVDEDGGIIAGETAAAGAAVSPARDRSGGVDRLEDCFCFVGGGFIGMCSGCLC